jgi:hypothetical protein
VTDASEIAASGITRLMSCSPTEKKEFVRVDPTTVSGRRCPKRFETTTNAGGGRLEATARGFTDHDRVLAKPWPNPQRPHPGQGR